MTVANETIDIHGRVVVELFGENGELKARCEVNNLVTSVGDQMYAERGGAPSGVTPPASPTGAQIGTGASTGGNAPAKTGTPGAQIQTYLIGQAFDSGFPTSTGGAGSARVITYKCTFAAGTGTTVNPVTEAVIINSSPVTTAALAANTITRVALTGIPSKAATDSLAVTWQHSFLG